MEDGKIHTVKTTRTLPKGYENAAFLCGTEVPLRAWGSVVVKALRY